MRRAGWCLWSILRCRRYVAKSLSAEIINRSSFAQGVNTSYYSLFEPVIYVSKTDDECVPHRFAEIQRSFDVGEVTNLYIFTRFVQRSESVRSVLINWYSLRRNCSLILRTSYLKPFRVTFQKVAKLIQCVCRISSRFTHHELQSRREICWPFRSRIWSGFLVPLVAFAFIIVVSRASLLASPRGRVHANA